MPYHNIGKILRKCYNSTNLNQLSMLTIRCMATVTADVKRYEDPQLANAKPFEEIPSIPTIPIIGSAWVYMPVIGRYSLQKQHIADRHKYAVYGEIVREKIGHLNFVHCYNPEAMEVLFKHEGQYPNRGEFSTLKAYRKYRKEWYKTTGVM
ncbi:Cytochrome P450 302a1, mitochondrial, partial [Stegodyphus mimosarum]